MWQKFNRWEVVSYGWAKKIISWDETAPGEDVMKTWNDKGFGMIFKFSR